MHVLLVSSEGHTCKASVRVTSEGSFSEERFLRVIHFLCSSPKVKGNKKRRKSIGKGSKTNQLPSFVLKAGPRRELGSHLYELPQLLGLHKEEDASPQVRKSLAHLGRQEKGWVRARQGGTAGRRAGRDPSYCIRQHPGKGSSAERRKLTASHHQSLLQPDRWILFHGLTPLTPTRYISDVFTSIYICRTTSKDQSSCVTHCLSFRAALLSSPTLLTDRR